ncbi:hypothetical protein BGZ47_003866 [Haplosporangium gracile]|nr:hypothetical protein BGZ47_003866 [Haplosporangium gracile]
MSKLKSVIWMEPLCVFDHFGVDGLCDVCLTQMVKSIKTFDVVKLLFEIGCAFETVMDAALHYIAQNLGSMFGEGKNAFKKLVVTRNTTI